LQRRRIKLPSSLPPVGAMIEIPGAAMAADALARVCDFFAIGSNDLTQYTLAIDRGDDRVADLYDPLHPAVLRLIQFTAAAGWRANIPVSLCGELAGDPQATVLLLGLGLRELSMAPLRLPAVKQEITLTTIQKAVALAEKVMNQSDEGAIRELLQKSMSEDAGEKRKRL
jgi:phosphotransferase system enzyme I (PtsI)